MDPQRLQVTGRHDAGRQVPLLAGPDPCRRTVAAGSRSARESGPETVQAALTAHHRCWHQVQYSLRAAGSVSAGVWRALAALPAFRPAGARGDDCMAVVAWPVQVPAATVG